jgi:hypothetical protein
VPLIGGDDVVGVLTLYADRARAFGETETERALMVASVAGVALSAAGAVDRADGLETALRNSRTIGMALGLLSERHGLTEDQAFELLRQSSMRSNRKLADLARDLVHGGELRAEEDALGWLDAGLATNGHALGEG